MAPTVLERNPSFRHSELVSGSTNQKVEYQASNEMLNQAFDAVSSGRTVQHDTLNPQEKTFEQRNLQEEITHLRKNWKKEDLPENWVDLPGIGFMIGYQMGFLDSEKLKPFSKHERVAKWTKLSVSSLKSWTMEYLAGKGVLPGLQTLEFEEGRWKYKDDLHGAGFELDETLSKKEANGLVWDMYINTIKPYFVTGTSAVTYSKSGKRMPGEDGVMINYVDSRHTFMEKRGKYIFTYTIANDLEDGEHVEFANELQKLGVQNTYTFTNESTAEDFIAHPTLFNTSGVKLSHILSLMGEIRERHGKKYVYKEKTASDLITESLSYKSLWDYDDVTKRFVEEFKEFSLAGDWNDDTKDILKEALSVTILRLSKYVKDKERNEKVNSTVTYTNGNSVTVFEDEQAKKAYYVYSNSNSSYGNVFTEVAAIPGCAGGGTNENNPTGSTPYDVSSFESLFKTFFGRKERTLECHCPKCDPDKKKGKVKAIIGNGKITCPRCNESASYQC